MLTALDEQGEPAVAGHSPSERVLIKFPASRIDPRISVRVIPVLLEDVPADNEERIVNEYLEISGDNFEQDELIVAQVTLSVGKPWMEANNVHQWSIEFSRFDENERIWKPALANRIGEDEDNVLYSLVVTEFSLWSITGSVEPPLVIFKVEELEISPSRPRAGDTVSVGATVTNILDEEAEHVAVLWLNSRMNSSRTLSRGPLESVEVLFEIKPEAGSYEVQIDQLVGRFEILVVEESGGGGFPWLVLLWIALGLTAGGLIFLAARLRRKRRSDIPVV